jgi:hypothetical protein
MPKAPAESPDWKLSTLQGHAEIHRIDVIQYPPGELVVPSHETGGIPDERERWLSPQLSRCLSTDTALVFIKSKFSHVSEFMAKLSIR